MIKQKHCNIKLACPEKYNIASSCVSMIPCKKDLLVKKFDKKLNFFKFCVYANFK